MAAFLNLRREKQYRNRQNIPQNHSKQLLRFESDSVDFITNYFFEENAENRGGALSSRKKIEIFLRYVSDPGFQSGVALDVGVERSTVCKTFSNVLDVIVERSQNWIKFPTTHADMEQAKEEWSSKYRLPTAIGAIDCTHVCIVKPTHFGDEYVNRKGKTSINVQITCNSREQITSVDAQWPGSVHDSRIWRMSTVQDVLRRYDGDVCLLGDSGYGISPWMLTPYDEVRNALEHQFNVVHAQERVVIERIFGQMKRRFPILSSNVRISVDKVPKLIISCAVLHNIGKHLNDVWDEGIDDGNDNDENHVNGCGILDHNEPRIRRRGQQKRLQITNNL